MNTVLDEEKPMFVEEEFVNFICKIKFGRGRTEISTAIIVGW